MSVTRVFNTLAQGRDSRGGNSGLTEAQGGGQGGRSTFPCAIVRIKSDNDVKCPAFILAHSRCSINVPMS